METYLVLAVAVSLLARFGFIWNNLLPAVIAVSLFAFYRALGAKPMDEWTIYRLAGDSLEALAADD